MKTHLLASFLLFSVCAAAQNKSLSHPPLQPTFHPATFEKTVCITEAQRTQVRQNIARNKAMIRQTHPDAFDHRGAHPLFILPHRPKAGFNDYGYAIINNQVDHDLTPNGHLLDYECGQRTYDWINGNHEGTDYVLWPYPWKRMQEEVMEIVAAAPGTIIDKRDGNFDLNCENNGNPLWNGIIIEHADGSQAWYWHFKSGAITSKNIGDTVAEGEYLGAAGSSGSSTIPHLHFEVYDASGNLIDPYEGSCNSMNPSSWWASQPDYFIPTINHLSTHNSTNFDTECGVVENTYEHLNFEPGDAVIFRIFYRDLRTDDDTHIVITKPDGTTLFDWVFTSPWPNYTGAYAEWNFPTDGSWQDGVYTVTATYYGNTYQTVFGINTNLGVEEEALNKMVLYPNPTNSQLFLESKEPIESILVYDLAGRKVQTLKPNTSKAEMDLSALSSGIYLIKATVGSKVQTFKVNKL